METVQSVEIGCRPACCSKTVGMPIGTNSIFSIHSKQERTVQNPQICTLSRPVSGKLSSQEANFPGKLRVARQITRSGRTPVRYRDGEVKGLHDKKNHLQKRKNRLSAHASIASITGIAPRSPELREAKMTVGSRKATQNKEEE